MSSSTQKLNIPEGLSPSDKENASLLYFMDKRAADDMGRPYYLDNWHQPTSGREPRTEDDKNKSIQSKRARNLAQAVTHYAEHAGEYHKQAIIDARAAGHDVNFQGDVALSV